MPARTLIALIGHCCKLHRRRSHRNDTEPVPPLSAAAIGSCGQLLFVLLVMSCVAAEPKKQDVPQVRRDRHGDPLPDGAIARLGTVRWRHGYLVYDLAYSPDGKMVAAVGCGRAITLWDTATGKEIHQFPNRKQSNAVAFSPNSKILATTDTPICRLWDVTTGKELRQLKGHTNGLSSVAFASDGKTLATSSYDGTARIWETSTGKELRCLDCEQGFLYGLAYSPDGKLLATGGKDGTIRLWDPTTARMRRQLEGHKDAIWRLAFSPDGKHLASSSDDQTIRLWQPAAGRQVRVLDEKPEGPREPIAFSPDSALLALGRWDGTIRLWDLENDKEKRRWQAGVTGVRAIAFSPDGKTLATGAWDGGIRLWDAASGTEKNPSGEHHGQVDFVRFSADGASLLSIGRDRDMLRWNLTANAPTRLFSWKPTTTSRFALSADGNTFAVSGRPDSHLRLWDVRTGKPGRALGKSQEGIFWPIAFSPDGRLVASEDDKHQVHVWDAREGKEVRQLKGFSSQASCLSFTPDSKALACGKEMANDGTSERALRLWDLSTGKERSSFASRAAAVDAIAFSPDGKKVASGEYIIGRKGVVIVQVWDALTGAELCRHTGHGERVAAIAFSPDGKLVASGAGRWGDKDNSVHVWEAATGRLICRFEGHHSCVSSVDFSPDGLIAASSAGDSTILLWDITGRRPDGHWHARPLTPRQLEACWTALANEDAAKAYDAVWAFVAAPEQAVPFLRKLLPPVPRPDAKAVSRHITDLDSDDFEARRKATEELTELGDAITPVLQQALDGKPSLEVRRRLQQLLDQSHDWTAERLRVHRAIQILEHTNIRSARSLLQTLAGGAPGTQRTQEAQAALRRSMR